MMSTNISDRKKIRRRDYKQVLDTDHGLDEKYDENTPAEVLFGSSGSCMLDPEVTEGPLCKSRPRPAYLKTAYPNHCPKGFVANRFDGR